MASEKVLVDIVFNPDTKQLEKVTQEVGKDNKVKITFDKPDVKELEGPFKELQEKAMAMANGGFARGLGQLKEGVSEFGNILKGGGDVSTALAGGLSKVGMEGATAFTALSAGALAAGAAFLALVDRGVQLDNTFKALGIDAKSYTESLNGAINAEQAFAIRNAASSVGLRLTGRQIAQLSNATDSLSQQSGDLQGTQTLITQALQGNKEAMYQLGIQYSETDTEIQRATRSVDELTKRSQNIGPKNLGFFEQIQVGFGRMSDGLASVLNDAGVQYASIFRTQQEGVNLSRQNAAIAADVARRAALARQDSENRSRLEQLNNQQQERANALAHDSIRVAQQGESTAQQILRSEMESVNINGQIQRLKEMVGGSDKEQEARRRAIADLERKEASEISRRNQLQSFSVQLADAQRARLVQMAIAQANHTGQNIRQLSLAEQLKMAERERARIVAAIVLAGGNITENQRRQLEGLQTFISQGSTQQAQAASQEAATRRQNEQAELALRYANEETRAKGEAYRLDVDSIDLAQRRTQIEAGLSGLYAYRGNTANREAARLAEIQRRTQELQQINQIMQTQEQTYLSRRLALESAIGSLANARAARAATAIDLSNREFANDQARLTMYNEITQRQRQGVVLTQAETQFLVQYNNATRDRVMLSGLLNAQIDQARADSVDSRLTQQERIAAEERLNQLLMQRIGLQRQEQERAKEASPMNSRLGKTLEGLAGGYIDVGDAAQGLASGALQQIGSAFSNLISTAAEGKISFGEAMTAMVKSTLISLSQMASVQALFQLATGFSKLAIGDTGGATNAFISAGMFAAVGVATGIGGGFIPSPENSGGNASSSKGPSGGATGAGEVKTSERSQGPVVINFNMTPYSTREDIEKSVAMAVYGYENRLGRNVRRAGR